MKHTDRSCPCLYLDKPCHDACSCVNGASSLGCLYCCTYGSLDQRKEKAEMLEKKYRNQPLPAAPEIDAGKILYPLELQTLVFDYVAWLESMITNVKKSLRPQIIQKIKELGEYKFAALPAAPAQGQSSVEQWYHNWMKEKGKSGSEVATVNVLDMLKDFAAQGQREVTPLTSKYLQEQYQVWIKETKRNGGVLIGSSVKEFFEWLELQAPALPVQQYSNPDREEIIKALNK